MKNIFLFTILSGVFLSACGTAPSLAPASYGEASLSLVFNGVEAEDTERLKVFFTMKAANPFPEAGRMTIESWRVEINGQEASGGLSLEKAGDDGNGFPSKGADFAAAETTLFPLRLIMNMAALANLGIVPAENYEVRPVLNVSFSFASGVSERFEVSGAASFPGVQPPRFSITSIAVLREDLINTRLRVTMMMENPNLFPIELSAFSYTLYGNGRFWSDGTERNITTVPGQSSAEANLFLLMNFMNMGRELLDQIIALYDVYYRFTGEVRVRTGIESFPAFISTFDLSGLSQVLDR